MTTKRQRQKENRAARLAAERKAAQWNRRKRLLRNVVIVAGVVFGAAFLLTLLSGNGDPEAATTTAEPGATTTSQAGTTTSSPGTDTTTPPVPTAPSYELFASQATACGGETPPAPAELTFTAPENQGIAADAVVTAVLQTSCGEISLDLDPSKAPQAVNSFVFLARQGYFDGTASHRIADLPGKIIQMGDPTATGSGNPGYRFDDELPPEGTTYGPGVLAMANSGPNTNGSQFFLTAGETELNNDFTIFGSFDPTQAAVAAILEIPLGPDQAGAISRPLQSIYIESVEITEG